jgi:hypothetical protein
VQRISLGYSHLLGDFLRQYYAQGITDLPKFDGHGHVRAPSQVTSLTHVKLESKVASGGRHSYKAYRPSLPGTAQYGFFVREQVRGVLQRCMNVLRDQLRMLPALIPRNIRNTRNNSPANSAPDLPPFFVTARSID